VITSTKFLVSFPCPIKITIRFHLTPVRVGTPTTNVGEGAGKKNPSYTAGGNVS
jgi:hypothetical protein